MKQTKRILKGERDNISNRRQAIIYMQHIHNFRLYEKKILKEESQCLKS